MKLTIFTSDRAGDKQNCSYPHRVTISTEAQPTPQNNAITEAVATMQVALANDHVCAEYRRSRRSKAGFLRSDCIVMDMDNDHSENPTDWITEQTMAHIFHDVNYVLATSRNHLKQKGEKAPRPRYHVYFPITDCKDMDAYEALKQELANRFSFFDDNAIDAARFIFGCLTEITWHEGKQNVDEWLTQQTTAAEKSTGVIPEGKRNSTMSILAAKLLKLHGDTEEAYRQYRKEALRCVPALPESELADIWASAKGFFHKKIETNPTYVTPEVFRQMLVEKLNRKPTGEGPQLMPEDFRDMDQARVMTRELGQQLKHTNATDLLWYGGTYWEESEAKAYCAMMEFLDRQKLDAAAEMNAVLAELGKLGVTAKELDKGKLRDSDLAQEPLKSAAERYFRAKAYQTFTSKKRDSKPSEELLNVARHLLNCPVDTLDANAYLLNTPGNTYNLTKGVKGAQEHNPADFITKITACDPGRRGERIWKKALDTFFCNDRELIEFMQEIVGTAALGKVYMEKLIVAYGGGRNGKSTFWNAIYRVLGTYAGTLSSDALIKDTNRNVMPELAELKGKRLIIASELEEGNELSSGMLKKLCSTDMIHAEKKYRDPFDFQPSHTLILYTNYLPKVTATDEGTWRRILVIPFNANIEGKNDIRNYADYLYENAGPAILQWVMEGAKRAIAKGFDLQEPEAVKAVMAQYREESDWLADFLEDCCEVGEGLSVPAGELYTAYREYCYSRHLHCNNNTTFAEALKRAGFEKRRFSKASLIYGIRLVKNEQEIL